MKRKLLSTLLAAAGLLAASLGHAQVSGNVVKIGVMNDMSGLYSDVGGPGSVVAAKMAVEDYLKASGSKLKVEVVSADHQNKPDVGSSIARKWFDSEGVDVIVDVPTSSVALAINQVTREKGKAFLDTGAATSDLTGKDCSPNTVHWLYDTWMLAHGTGSAVVKQGGDSWFFLTADYAFGHALERDTTEVIKAAGGKATLIPLDLPEGDGIERLAGVFLHRSGDLGDADSSNADRLFSALLELKTQGIAGKIGVSVYDPSELDAVFHRFPLDVVQAPYNVLDRRIETSGWLGRLSRAGVEVHCRSAFLQGLLLMKSEVRPPHFHQWGGLLAVWDEWLAESGQSALSAALGFACANPLVDRVVVGVDGAAQLDEILDAMDVSYSAPPPGLFTNDPELINPARWKLS